jgi:hypothetical protein
MKLFKRQDRYDLYADTDHKVASSAPNPFGKLSKENCDALFGVVDVEKLAGQEVFQKYYDWGGEVFREDYLISKRLHFIEGFNKAMELNKDKLFTLEDMRNTMDWIMTQYFEFYEQPTTGRREQYLESLQQPAEIEVEIVMEDIIQLKKRAGGLTNMGKPKLDSNGNLILRKL